jgi:hypothetical protein
MTDPITPPPELVRQWASEWMQSPNVHRDNFMATRAAQWGADREMEACCKEMKSLPSPLGIPFGEMVSNALRAARRPKPPSLKEQALADLDTLVGRGRSSDTIRRALEALPNE